MHVLDLLVQLIKSSGKMFTEVYKKQNDSKSEQLDAIVNLIISSAIKVHRFLGPGLLESAYETCLVYELRKNGLKVDQQMNMPLKYEEIELDCGYRLDILVENSIILEIKSVATLLDVHRAQLLSYLKLSGCKVGLLMNFNTVLLKDGIIRMVNNFRD